MGTGQHSAGKFHATTGFTGSGLKTDPGEDQAAPSALTTVVRQCPAGTGWHSASRFWTKTGSTGSGLKTDPGEDQAGRSLLSPDYSCQAMSTGVGRHSAGRFHCHLALASTLLTGTLPAGTLPAGTLPAGTGWYTFINLALAGALSPASTLPLASATVSAGRYKTPIICAGCSMHFIKAAWCWGRRLAHLYKTEEV